MQQPKPPRPYAVPALMLLPLAVLLTACGATLPPSPSSLPPLPPAARQEPAPETCSPTCSDGWRRLVESLLPKPTEPEQPAKPANGPMTR